MLYMKECSKHTRINHSYLLADGFYKLIGLLQYYYFLLVKMGKRLSHDTKCYTYVKVTEITKNYISIVIIPYKKVDFNKVVIL